MVVSDIFDEFINNIDITEVKDEFIFFPTVFCETAKILRIGSTVYTSRYIVCVNTTFFVAEYPVVKVYDATKVYNTSKVNPFVKTIFWTILSWIPEGNIPVLSLP